MEFKITDKEEHLDKNTKMEKEIMKCNNCMVLHSPKDCPEGFDLSEKIEDRINKFSQDKISDINCIVGIKKDVKEFIKLLKEEIVLNWNSNVERDIPINPKEIDEIIDILAGDKLI